MHMKSWGMRTPCGTLLSVWKIAVTVILIVGLTGLADSKQMSKTHLWVCLWGNFWKALHPENSNLINGDLLKHPNPSNYWEGWDCVRLILLGRLLGHHLKTLSWQWPLLSAFWLPRSEQFCSTGAFCHGVLSRPTNTAPTAPTMDSNCWTPN